MEASAQDVDAREPSVQGLDGAVLALLLLAFAMRAFRLGDQIVFGDEVITLRAMLRHDPIWLLTTFRVHDFSGLFAVYYQAVAASVGLDEWTMRLPVLLGGSLTPILLWRALRPHLDRKTLLLCLSLVALSPILIHHSRFARPYTLILDLEIVAATSLWLLLHTRSTRALAVHCICAALSMYLNLSSAVFLASLWLAAGVFSLLTEQPTAEAKRARIAPILKGIAGSAALTLLVYIPSHASWDVLINGRSGKGEVSLASVFEAFQLVVGTPNLGWNLVLGSLIAMGLVAVFRTSRAVGTSAMILLVLPTLLVAALNPHRAQLPHVFVRYLMGVVPVAIVLIAFGTGSLIDALTGRLKASSPLRGAIWVGVGILLVLGLASAGPLPNTHLRLNNLALHPLHIRFLRFPGAIDRVPAIYREIASDPRPGIVIEAPWCGTSGMGIPLEIYQRVHGREMVVIPAAGQYDAPGFEFNRMQTLAILDALPEAASYWLIIHLDIHAEIEHLLHDNTERRECDPSEIAEKIESRYGEPVYRDKWIAAYAITS